MQGGCFDWREAWTYWTGGEQFGFWSGIDPVVPVAVGKIYTAHSGYHLWHLVFRNYTVEHPPASAFSVTAGVKCPPARGTPAAGAPRLPPLLSERLPRASSLASMMASAEERLQS